MYLLALLGEILKRKDGCEWYDSWLWTKHNNYPALDTSRRVLTCPYPLLGSSLAKNWKVIKHAHNRPSMGSVVKELTVIHNSHTYPSFYIHFNIISYRCSRLSIFHFPSGFPTTVLHELLLSYFKIQCWRRQIARLLTTWIFSFLISLRLYKSRSFLGTSTVCVNL